MRVHVRCRKCDGRRVLRQHPLDYHRAPTCACGGSYRSDKWMNERNTKAASCHCAAYWFQHREGSRYCHFRADGTKRRFGNADFHDRALELIELEKEAA